MIINKTPIPAELSHLFTDIMLVILVDREYRCINSDKEENVNALIKQQAIFRGQEFGSLAWFYRQRYLTTPNKVYILAGKDHLQLGELITSIDALTSELKRSKTARNYRLRLPTKLSSVIYSANMSKLPDNVFIDIYQQEN